MLTSWFGVFRRMSPDVYTGPIFAIFSQYESANAIHADNGSVPYFPICQGMLP